MALISPPRPTATHPALADLITAVRATVETHADWHRTATLVAAQLRRNLPPIEVLTAGQRAGDPETYRSHLLHAEPNGAFSIVGLVWLPGQVTPIHDHITWCVFGVIQGVEYEELYLRRDDHLVAVGGNENHAGEVSGFAPPGDIHRVRNVGGETAISLHIYGTDISRVETSVRRCYDLPVTTDPDLVRLPRRG